MRLKLLFTPFFIFILLLSSCNKAIDNTIKIGIPDGPSAITFIKMIDHPATFNGKKIEFIIKDDPQQIQLMLLKNKLDFAILPTIMAANLYNKGIDYKMAACPLWGTLYLITNLKTDTVFTKLQNKTIYTFGEGATPDILLQQFISENHISNVRIDYSYSGNAEISRELLQKKIHFAVVSEPMVSQLQILDKNIEIVSKLTPTMQKKSGKMNIFVQTALMVNNQFAKNNTQATKSILKLYSESCSFVTSHPDSTASLVVKHGFMKDSIAALKSIKLCNINFKYADKIQQQLNSYFKIYYDFNPATIGGKLPDKNFIFSN